jgi:hypothetical protein
MNRLNLDDVVQDKVKITVKDTETGLNLIFNGEIDMEDPGIVLDPLFDKIHKGALDNGFKDIIADFNSLNFLNSSGIKAIAKWVMKLSDLSENNRYIIKIRHNKDITWQVTSLPTLTYLVVGAVEII